MSTRRPIRETNLGKSQDISSPRRLGRLVLDNLNREPTLMDTPLPTSPLTIVGGAEFRLGAKETISQDILNIGIAGGGLVLETGVVDGADFELPFNGHFVAARLVSDAVGSIVIDIWKDSYANFPPTVADTITASAKPTLSAAQRSEDTTLVGWTRNFIKGDWLRFNIDSIATITGCNLTLTVERD